MTNDCVRIGLEFEKKNKRTPSMKKLSLLCYKQLGRYSCYSSYRLTAISKAAGILSARAKSISRGFPTKTPYLSKPVLVSCYGFKVQGRNLVIHLGSDTFESIPLNLHTLSIISDQSLKVRSFTLTERSLSLCVSREVRTMEEHELTRTVGVDRNLRNVTVGNSKSVTYYDLTSAVEIGQNTRSIISSFKRDDHRIRGRIFSKYGRRRSARIKQILHAVSKDIVQMAKTEKAAIVFEDIGDIRKLYRKGNGQGRSFRARMNSAPWYELKRQVEYKAAWEGVPVITLTKSETMGTSMCCPRCGEPMRGLASLVLPVARDSCGGKIPSDPSQSYNYDREHGSRLDSHCHEASGITVFFLYIRPGFATAACVPFHSYSHGQWTRMQILSPRNTRILEGNLRNETRRAFSVVRRASCHKGESFPYFFLAKLCFLPDGRAYGSDTTVYLSLDALPTALPLRVTLASDVITCNQYLTTRSKRLQSAARNDMEHQRMLWCKKCGRWQDRDMVAVLNISRRGWLRFGHSKTQEGEAGEAMRGNPEHEGEPVILRVDASKFRRRT